MRKIISALTSLFSGSNARSSQSNSSIDISGLSEASMNFDQENVGPFLDELSLFFTSDLDAAALTKKIELLQVGQTGNWEFTIALQDTASRLVVVAFKDDMDAPDLAFHTSPEMAARIQGQLVSFAEARGL